MSEKNQAYEELIRDPLRQITANWCRLGPWRTRLYRQEPLPVRLWHRWIWNDQRYGPATGLPTDNDDYDLIDNEQSMPLMVLWWRFCDVVEWWP